MCTRLVGRRQCNMCKGEGWVLVKGIEFESFYEDTCFNDACPNCEGSGYIKIKVRIGVKCKPKKDTING